MRLRLPLRQVTFASSNEHKFREAQAILLPFKIEVIFASMQLPELQSDSLAQIAAEKAKSAFAVVSSPVIVEDDGLFVDSLKGFPGQYSSFVFQTIGNDGVLKLMAGSIDRAATFRSVIAYRDRDTESISEGVVKGRIAESASKGGWGYDPIFVPDGTSLTFAELGKEKNRFSHRKRGLENFARWLLQRA